MLLSIFQFDIQSNKTLTFNYLTSDILFVDDTSMFRFF
jgi:hypothetical protein